jgi:hypothetical protein
MMVCYHLAKPMELTYQVRGADDKEYGPVTFDQLQVWVRERRLTPQQQIKRSDMQHWAPASSFSELQALFETGAGTPGPMAPAPASAAADQAAVARMKSDASWFYWIAGLSLINSIAAASGSNWRFIIGLGITQLIDSMGSAPAVALVLDFLVAGFFILLGVFAHKAQTWAFLIGMILFALDGVIFLLASDWIGVVFHVVVLFFLFRGFKACRQVRAAAG